MEDGDETWSSEIASELDEGERGKIGCQRQGGVEADEWLRKRTWNWASSCLDTHARVHAASCTQIFSQRSTPMATGRSLMIRCRAHRFAFWCTDFPLWDEVDDEVEVNRWKLPRPSSSRLLGWRGNSRALASNLSLVAFFWRFHEIRIFLGAFRACWLSCQI